ncbi:cation transport ATPase [Weissella uvarum]|uniref:CPBP family intramembrane glutamic endopeptidase n=1 Tax=Weissella uvarum TaxID=1479233 RepID=UPI001960D664|nr:CPBP family intramembrane glutamic endopeptidase [Weissella uvarum]MBM7617189.1 cation transport ATPase [Weissella uvarum]MCM0595483.1 CPBP family intramembrane metalloprotease [Weissella uvarum]
MFKKMWNLKYLSALLVIPAIVYVPVLLTGNKTSPVIEHNPWLQVLIAGVTYIPVFFLAIFYWSDGILKPDWKKWREKWISRFIIAFSTAAFMLVLIVPLARFLGNTLAPYVSMSAAAFFTQNLPTILLMLIPLLSAFTEEIVYHHALIEPFADSKWQYLVMSLVSNVMFTLIHINNADWKLSNLIMYFLLGVVFQVIYMFSHKNIWQNIMTHLIYNSFIAVPTAIIMLVTAFM